MIKTKKPIQNNNEFGSLKNQSTSNEPAIILVSGLPRSGTSMMMQMLEAGGTELIVDHIRKSDEDNPKGYYEFEKIKQLEKDSSWMENASGKAVKVISMLLYQLPMDKKYKIIFMKRKIYEVLASQNKMLKRRGHQTDIVDDQVMAEKFNKHLGKIFKWLNKQINMETIFINYNDVVSSPMEQLKNINQFLGNILKIDKMVNVVDHFLYRQRK
jgi:broad-specificity NMP kinase